MSYFDSHVTAFFCPLQQSVLKVFVLGPVQTLNFSCTELNSYILRSTQMMTVWRLIQSDSIHFAAICRQTESRTLHGAYFSIINVFASCKFILLLSFKNEAVIYLTRSNCSRHFGNRTIERSVLLSLVTDHDNRRVSDFARLPKEIKANRNLYDHSM